MISAIARFVAIGALLTTSVYFIAQGRIAMLSAQCHEQWNGYGTVYSIQTGCLVQVGDGRWAPEANVKVTIK